MTGAVETTAVVVGHGFKHSAAIGEAVADWVAAERQPEWIDLGAFSFAAAG